MSKPASQARVGRRVARKARPDGRDVARGRGRCPVCGSRSVRRLLQGATTFYARELERCNNCNAFWEPLPPGDAVAPDHTDSDGSPFPFPQPCGNCAFRTDSPERRDPETWAKIMAMVENLGGLFFCHKGHRLIAEDPGFDYPTKPDGTPDARRMRVCRGFLNSTGAALRKKYPA